VCLLRGTSWIFIQYIIRIILLYRLSRNTHGCEYLQLTKTMTYYYTTDRPTLSSGREGASRLSTHRLRCWPRAPRESRHQDGLTDRLNDRLTDWLTEWMTLTGWQIDWPTDWLTGRQTGWLTDRPTDWLTERLTDWPKDRLTYWLTASHNAT